MAGDDPADHVSQVGPWLDPNELARLNQRGNHRPVRGPTVRAGKQCVFAREGQRAHAALDHVGVDLNSAVVEEQAQAGPPGEGVADRLRQPALLAHQGQLLAEPGLEGLHQRPTALLANSAALVRRAATDLALNPVQRRDAGQRLGGDRRWSTLGEFVKGPTHVAPAEGELHLTPPGQGFVGLVAVHLQHTLEPSQMRRGPLCRAIGRVDNVVERSMRPLALTRKNALFAGSDGGAAHWAVIASLVETCKLVGVEPRAYLADVISRIVNGHPQSRLDELLPWAYPTTPALKVAA